MIWSVIPWKRKTRKQNEFSHFPNNGMIACCYTELKLYIFLCAKIQIKDKENVRYDNTLSPYTIFLAIFHRKLNILFKIVCSCLFRFCYSSQHCKKKSIYEKNLKICKVNKFIFKNYSSDSFFYWIYEKYEINKKKAFFQSFF